MGKFAKRGFASMTKEQQVAIQSKGGKVVHQKGRAHTWTRAEAIIAGSKGGKATRAAKRAKDVTRTKAS